MSTVVPVGVTWSSLANTTSSPVATLRYSPADRPPATCASSCEVLPTVTVKTGTCSPSICVVVGW